MPQKNQNKTVVLIGSGNVATHMGIAIKNAGHTILQVYSPNKKNAELLAKKVSGEPISKIGKVNTEADVYIIAVKDDAIKTIAKKLSLKNSILVHTSGSTSSEVLKGSARNYGVIYPLQTFSRNSSVNFYEVPLFIEASNRATQKILRPFATTLSKNVHNANSDKRKYLHLAAVFACNFTNHMYSCAQMIAAGHNIPFSTFIPLIEETAKKVKQYSPLEAQTGPAVRNDKKTMKLQEKLLKDDPRLKKLYKLISANIKKSTSLI